MKKLLWIVVIVVVLLVVLVAAAWLMIDPLAKTGIEKGGTYAMGVPTTLEDIDISLLNGTLSMKGLKIANPQGFNSPHLMKTGTFDLKVQPGSVFGDTVVVDKFELDGLDMNIEQTAEGNNVSVVMDNLKKLGGGGGEQAAPQQEPTSAQPQEQPTQQPEPAPQNEPAAEEGKKVKVNRVVIRNVQAHFYLPNTPSDKPITVTVPELVLENVADDNQGVTVARLMGKLMPAIVAGVVKQARGKVSAAMLSDLNQQAGSVAGALGGDTQNLLKQSAGQLGGDMPSILNNESADPNAEKKPGLLDGLLKKDKSE